MRLTDLRRSVDMVARTIFGFIGTYYCLFRCSSLSPRNPIRGGEFSRVATKSMHQPIHNIIYQKSI